ncbi:MAG: serine/threonine protein kinase, partial [Holophagales bacterium]|nr:serine/threonine protein kinase [Holophagales bacterium]
MPTRPDRLRQIASVLETCLELDPGLRSSYLDSLGSTDPELKAAVLGHLSDASGPEVVADTSLDTLTGGGPGRRTLTTGTPDPTDDGGHRRGPPDATHIGPYRIQSWLGAGGMGSVYLAERDDEEFRRQVAVKVVSLPFPSPELLRRFRSERQILATFDHPNIARLYDGGTTADGRPYLAMEYVDGPPLPVFCDEQGQTVRHRLELFRKVCAAVQYAHARLVVHRDLKPSNVLVTSAGEPKLLDFGIAKLLDRDDPGGTGATAAMTLSGMRLM